MDLIDREQAIRACFGMIRDTGIDELPYEYAESELSNVPTVEAIPLSVIDEIKAEIKDESYSKQSFNEDVYEYEDRCVDLEDAMRIINETVKEYTSCQP